ncbi:MAG TPA: ankyrin repeat domain-containing protein, partial [Kiritimatiellia bacterium]|nr:ankyrin repeat domain-containing protein [Kiritimatiellia bacterium]
LVNVSDEDGMTPLHHAALNNYAQCAEVLLEAGAEWNATNHAGQTPLDLATQHQNAKTLAVLRRYGSVEKAP